jgi:5'-nucleotidase
MNKLLSLFGVSLLFSSCASHPIRQVAAAEPGELVIVATSDFHSALDHAEGLASVVRSLKQKYGNQMIFLDGGDQFQGSIEGNMSKGRAIVEVFNRIGLDAAAIGNHELDYGPDVAGRVTVKPKEDGLGNLKARIQEARYKWLSVNFTGKNGKKVFESSASFDRSGYKVCVVGATTPGTQYITRPEFITGMEFHSLKESIEKEAKQLRATGECRAVILTAHAGLNCNADGKCLERGDRAEILNLLEALPAGTLDAVVAGHTHIKAQEVVNGTPIIEAGAHGKWVGVLRLKPKANGFDGKFESFIPVPDKAPSNADSPDVSDITSALEPYRKSAQALKDRPIETKAGTGFEKNYIGENALGNMIADAILSAGKEAEGAQFAIINAGGIRADLPSGELKYGDVFNVLPFDNSLAVVHMKGSELRRLLEIAFSGGHGSTPVSGFRIKRLHLAPGIQDPKYSRDLNDDGKKEDWERNLLIDVRTVDGATIDDDKTYKLATVDFLVSGGDHQAVVYDSIPAKRKHQYPGVWMRDIVIEYLKNKKEFQASDFYKPGSERVENVNP